MANLGGAFDATSVEPSAPMEVIPAGEYVAEIINSEMKPTKNGQGEYLALEFVITDGPFQNRHLFSNLNLKNANAQAAEIAARDLSAICHAIGKLQVLDSDDLHHHRMIITVKVRPAGPDKTGVVRDAQNEIRGFKSLSAAKGVNRAPVANRSEALAVTSEPSAAVAAAVAPKSNAPWRRPPT